MAWYDEIVGTTKGNVQGLVDALRNPVDATKQFLKGGEKNRKIASALLQGNTAPLKQAFAEMTPQDLQNAMVNAGVGFAGTTNPVGKFKYDVISHNLPLVNEAKNTSPFIGYLTKNGEHELFDAIKAAEADYHHSNLVKNLDNYDLDSTLRFVRMGGENRFTLTGDAALDPYHPHSKKQIEMLSKTLQERGADPNANFLISDMALPFNEAPYQNKEIGKLSDWYKIK